MNHKEWENKQHAQHWPNSVFSRLIIKLIAIEQFVNNRSFEGALEFCDDEGLDIFKVADNKCFLFLLSVC